MGHSWPLKSFLWMLISDAARLVYGDEMSVSVIERQETVGDAEDYSNRV